MFYKAVDVLKYVPQVTDISDGVVGDLSTFRGDLSASKNHPPISGSNHDAIISLCLVDASKAGEGQLEISINDGDVPNAVQVC